MTRRQGGWVLSLGMLGLCTLMAMPGEGQMRRETPSAPPDRSSPGESIVRIRRLEGVGKKAYIKTPDFTVRGGMPRGVNPPQDWVQILVEYDTRPKWLDDLVVQFFALGVTVEEGKKLYSFYQLTVRYGDIEEGRGHLATAYLRPQAVKRFGDLVAVAVEFTHEGKLVAEQSESVLSGLPARWWRDPSVVNAEHVVTRNGYLLDKNQSPFALINIDDHEVIR